MASTRLPGKVMADLCGRPALEQMLGRVRGARLLDAVIVATTTNATDDPVAALCERLETPLFRGDETDVLGRYAAAAAADGADCVVRLTADCPMHDPAVIDGAVAMYAAGAWDYVSNVNRRTYPKGLDVEVMSARALTQAAQEARHPFLREHVTPYIRGLWPAYGAGNFRRGDFVFPADFSHVRWTVDTATDLAAMRELWAAAPENFTWLQALGAATRDPRLLNSLPAPVLGLALRRAEFSDAELLFQWVNESTSLAGKLQTAESIGWDTHVAWLRSRLADPASRLWIAYAEGLPVGQIRIERRPSGDLEIDVYVSPHHRRRGWALAMLRAAAGEAARAFPGEPLTAQIRAENDASRRLFTAAGYGLSGARNDILVMRRHASPA